MPSSNFTIDTFFISDENESSSEDTDIESDDPAEYIKREEQYNKVHSTTRINKASELLLKSLGRKADDSVFNDTLEETADKDKPAHRKREDRGSSGSTYAAFKAHRAKKLRRGSNKRLSSTEEAKLPPKTSRAKKEGAPANKDVSSQPPAGPKCSDIFPRTNWPQGMTKETVDLLSIQQYQVQSYNSKFN